MHLSLKRTLNKVSLVQCHSCTMKLKIFNTADNEYRYYEGCNDDQNQIIGDYAVPRKIYA